MALILGYRNLIDRCAVSGGSYEATLPLGNIQDRRLSKRARTTGLSGGRVDITLPPNGSGLPYVTFVAVAGHNLTDTGTIRVRGYEDSSYATAIYDSGTGPVWPVVADYGATPGLAVVLPDHGAWLPCWRIDLADPDNAAGYLEFGRVFIGQQWEPTPPDFGWSLGYEDPTVVEESLGGAEYFDLRRLYRVLKIGFSYLEDGEADAALEIQRVAGIGGELVVAWDWGTVAGRSFIGRMRALNPLESPDPVRFSMAFEVRETVA
ncbi:hypothetical protein [Methylomagnum ishizawai]|uniref:hypothetical protein n=1 Tax=Methylomagnum ishizawai TaxID=1760988 RepID=UPI001C31F277|nr:hypothetical protein [Methylomagnum ishizawai]BBL75569.1 hypothetical protein MishRS11D_26670 [Methylomagnum ishizawai]